LLLWQGGGDSCGDTVTVFLGELVDLLSDEGIDDIKYERLQVSVVYESLGSQVN